MRNLRKFSVGLVTVFALAAIAASSASAQLFTASAKGAAITGMSNTAQVFNDTAGSNINKVTCSTATVNGVTEALSSHEQTVTVDYDSGFSSFESKNPVPCNAFIGTAMVSTANYRFPLANGNASNNLNTGNVAIESPIAIDTSLGCNVSISPQTVGTVAYSSASGKITVVANVNNVNSTGNGGICGTVHTGGSYVGTTILESAGTLGFDVTG